MITILGHDTGVTNGCVAVVSFRPNPKNKNLPWQFNIRTLKILPNTLSDMKSDQTGQLKKYVNDVMEIFNKYSVDHLVAERFMIRSFRTATAEYICVMLGALDNEMRWRKKKPPVFIPAVTWKNAVNRLFNLKDFYKQVHALPHECDSVLMAFHQAGCLDLLATEKARKELQWKLEQKTSRPAKRVAKKKPVKKAAKKKSVKK